MTTTYKITIPAIPPSYNKHLKIVFNLRYIELTREAKDFKNTVKRYMTPWEVSTNSMFDIDISIHNSWFFKNNKLQKKDVQNLDKLLCDAIFEKLGIGDEQIRDLHTHKVRDKKTFTQVTIKVVSTIDEFRDTIDNT